MGHWGCGCCTRQQTDMSECVWALYQSSDACHVTSDPWRSVRDVPTVRGHLSFLNTHFRARTGVVFRNASSFSGVFSFCHFSSSVTQVSFVCFGKVSVKFLPRFPHCFCTSVLVQQAAVISLYLFHREETLTQFGANSHSSSTSLQLVSNESQHTHKEHYK